MQILLPDPIVQQLTGALRKAGRREIGGILMGEHIAEDSYCVRSITIQYQGGTTFFFYRAIEGIRGSLSRFYGVTNYNYTRFNYLGEWHSHPSFSLEPSSTDCDTMWQLVQDSQVGANFAVLIIVSLGSNNELGGTATIFLPGRQRSRGILVREGNTA